MEFGSFVLVGLCILLFLGCLGLILYLLSVRKQLRSIRKELDFTRQQDYNRQVTVTLFDKEVTALAAQINKNLDYQKRLKLETEQAEQQMKQSISDIAHDLRTPLTVIKGNLQMLDKGENIPEASREYLRICMEKSDTLKTMVDDFFEMSVLESDHAPAPLQKVNVTNLLMQFLIDNEAVIRQYGLTPELELPEKSVMILADEQMLVRMFSNLLNNILKYASQSFSVALEIQERTRCKITFSNAIGEERCLDVDHLFDRNYRGDMARRGGGAGLGLYIVKLLAEKQNAEVYAKQEGNRLCVCLIYHML
jgi:signal transduction histidine kinase